MGKSSKNSATKVDEFSIVVPQSTKKGKRGREKEIEKAVRVKKQKVETDEIVVAKQKAQKQQPKKAVSSSSENEFGDVSQSDTEPKIVSRKTPTLAKNGSVGVKKSMKNVSSDCVDTSGSDSDDSNEKPGATLNNGTSSDTSSSEGSDSATDSDSSKEKNVARVLPAAASKGRVDSRDGDSDEDEDEDEDSSDSSDSNEEPKAKTPEDEKQAQSVSTSSEGSSDDGSSNDETSTSQPVNKVQASNKIKDKSFCEDESDEEENQKQSLKTPKERETDIDMVDANKSAASTFPNIPKTAATPEPTGSKKLFVANLSFSVEESHVREFFIEAGEVVDVILASNAEGQFRGFCHVDFATAEAAKKAMKLHGQRLLGRPVRLNLARERGAFTPQSRGNNSFQKGGKAQGRTAFIRGLDTNLGVDKIKSDLQEHFRSCGKIKRIYIPRDNESGGVKGTAYIDFADNNGLNSALEKDGSDLSGGYCLSVKDVKPKGDSVGGRFERGGRSGGRTGGREDGLFSGRGGRDSGRDDGRFSGKGSRDGGRGRGRGTPYNKPSVTSVTAMGITAMASGKKTTFGDD